MIVSVIKHVQARQEDARDFKPQFNITHEVHVTLEGLIGDFAWWKLVSLP
jgi:hypothetical protein